MLALGCCLNMTPKLSLNVIIKVIPYWDFKLSMQRNSIRTKLREATMWMLLIYFSVGRGRASGLLWDFTRLKEVAAITTTNKKSLISYLLRGR